MAPLARIGSHLRRRAETTFFHAAELIAVLVHGSSLTNRPNLFGTPLGSSGDAAAGVSGGQGRRRGARIWERYGRQVIDVVLVARRGQSSIASRTIGVDNAPDGRLGRLRQAAPGVDEVLQIGGRWGGGGSGGVRRCGDGTGVVSQATMRQEACRVSSPVPWPACRAW